MIRKPAAFVAVTALGLLALALVPATFAAKGGGGAQGGGGKPGGSGSSSLDLVVLNSPSNDGLPHYGGQVTFTVSTAATEKPMVNVDCHQGSILVYRSMAGFFPEYPWPWNQTFTLQSTVWPGGSASCVATLYYVNSRGRSTTLATRAFDALA